MKVFKYSFLLGLFFCFSNNLFAKSLKILQILPSGSDVGQTRQITFRFNQNVVPLGKMERKNTEIPISITPKVSCDWRWIDRTTLACQLANKTALSLATKYNIEVKPGLKTEGGATLSSKITHSFTTLRPKSGYVSFNTWKSPGLPILRVSFNQPVSQKSVQESLYYSVNGSKVSIKVYEPKNEVNSKRYVRVAGDKYFKDYGATKKKGEVARRFWLVEPVQELPLDSLVALFISPGLVSVYGPEKGIEKRLKKSFGTFPEFKFIGLKCLNNLGKRVFIKLDEIKPNPNRDVNKCNPVNGAADLVFSAPVLKNALKGNIQFIPDLANGREDYDPWAESYSWSRLSSFHRKDSFYTISLPDYLRAETEYKISASEIKDEFGRKLSEPIDFSFYTDMRKPSWDISHNKGIVEKGIGNDIPLYTTNLEKLEMTYQGFNAKDKFSNKTKEYLLKNPRNVSVQMPMGLEEILNNKSGAIFGKIESTPDVKKYNQSFFAQSTHYQMIVKFGHFNTLVWVTDMRTGKSVKGAKVELLKGAYTNLSSLEKKLDAKETDANGLSFFSGLDELDPQLQLTRVWGDNEKRYFVKVIKNNEMALLPLDSNFLIDTYRLSESGIYPSIEGKYGHLKAWGTTAQGVYKLGDKVQYKIYVRDQNVKSFTVPPSELYDLKVMDPMNKVAFEKKGIKLNEFGSLAGEFKISKSAPMGWYQFTLTANISEIKMTLYPLKVLVTDFTPAIFKVENTINGERFSPGDTIKIDTYAKLHSGGPYTDASSRATITLTETQFAPTHPIAKQFTFQPYVAYSRQRQLFQNSQKINSKGSVSDSYKLKDQKIQYGKMYIESAVRDDRGKNIATSKAATYLGVNRFVGLKNTKWTYQSNQEAEIEYLVVDPSGQSVKGIPVNIKVEYKKTKSSRVKGAGNAYLTKYTHEMIEKSQCKGRSLKEQAVCTFTPDEAGQYKITATIKDTKGRVHTSSIWSWVTGKNYIVWESSDTNALNIIPENESYKVGDTAKYLVKNPFPNAKALITLERYGVVKQWVEDFDTSTPIVEFKITEDLLPGFYLSIAVVSPRVEKLKGYGKLDLGKPTFRMGYIKVPVKDQYKDIVITAKSDKEVYKPRDKAKISISAKERFASNKDHPIELAVAVLDEAVFDLIKGGSRNFDPYNGFYKLDDLDLTNYSLLTRLLGRQKFQKKEANQGGDGAGSGSRPFEMRSIFKYLSYWNPSIKLKNGKANIEVTLPDNLTSWKIITMAVTPEDKMGLGQSSFKVNRKTEIQPVTPNQVAEGDEFVAAFTVMNRTEKMRKVKVTIAGTGHLVKGEDKLTLEKEVKLAPFKRELVKFKVKVSDVENTRNVKTGVASFMVKASDKIDQDAIYHKIPVHKRRSLMTAASFGTTDKANMTEDILLPKNIYPDVGMISLTTTSSVIGTLEGAFKYLRDYPYSCWEQKLSKAVMASHYQNLNQYIDTKKVPWEKAQDLPYEILEDARTFQAPNGGMTFFISQNQYVSPYLSAYTALAFQWLKKSGYAIPTDVERNLYKYLLKMLRKNVFPRFYREGMSSTVRAVALAALASAGKVKAQDVLRYQKHFKDMSLFGKSYFLQAAIDVGDESLNDAIKMAMDNILSSGNITSGKYVFSETFDDGYSRILSSQLRTNCSILSAFVKHIEQLPAKANVQLKDVPFKIVNFLTQSRKSRSHWENTQENIFCMNALVDYSRKFESETPNFEYTANFAGNEMGKGMFKTFKDPMQIYDYPFKKEHIGKKEKLELTKKGNGRLYYTTKVSYAPKDAFTKLTNAGIDIRKEYQVERGGKWQLLKRPFKIKKGELVKVDIFISAPAARNFVVVNDPIPGGLEPVNKDLATSSQIDADKGEYVGSKDSWYFKLAGWSYYGISRWSFYHKELRHNAAVFYSEYLPPGNYHLSYVAQAIAVGNFLSSPVHAEEMYNPEIFGKGISGKLEVIE